MTGIKRYIAVLLALCLAAGLLCGCSREEKEPETVSQSSEPREDAVQVTPEVSRLRLP